MIVDEHMKDLEENVKALIQLYGNRRLSLKKLVEYFSKNSDHPKIWGKFGQVRV